MFLTLNSFKDSNNYNDLVRLPYSKYSSTELEQDKPGKRKRKLSIQIIEQNSDVDKNIRERGRVIRIKSKNRNIQTRHEKETKIINLTEKRACEFNNLSTSKQEKETINPNLTEKVTIECNTLSTSDHEHEIKVLNLTEKVTFESNPLSTSEEVQETKIPNLIEKGKIESNPSFTLALLKLPEILSSKTNFEEKSSVNFNELIKTIDYVNTSFDLTKGIDNCTLFFI